MSTRANVIKCRNSKSMSCANEPTSEQCCTQQLFMVTKKLERSSQIHTICLERGSVATILAGRHYSCMLCWQWEEALNSLNSKPKPGHEWETTSHCSLSTIHIYTCTYLQKTNLDICIYIYLHVDKKQMHILHIYIETVTQIYQHTHARSCPPLFLCGAAIRG